MRYLPSTTVRALDIQGIGPLSRFIEKVLFNDAQREISIK